MHTLESARTSPATLGGLAALAALAALSLSAGSADASTSRTTERISLSAEGAVFSCQGGDLTATSGTFNQLIHTNVDGPGVFHITVTITPDGVRLTDPVGNGYTLSGASRIGGKAAGPDAESPIILATETEHLVVQRSTGGVYAKVQSVEHVSSNGRAFIFDGGTCEPPRG
jgi:hypothetical protein